MLEVVSDVLYWTTTHRHTNVGRLVRTFNHQLCVDTGSRLEDLPRAITERVIRERESKESVMSACLLDDDDDDD